MTKMKIFIRTDSSIDIGSGHLMRCLTLADKLTEKGAEVSFICRTLPGNLCEHVEKKGYKVHRLPQIDPQNDLSGQTTAHADWLGVDWETDALQTIEILTEKQADWLIVDHYAIDYRWEGELRPYSKRIMVIDDLADRKHDCDLLLDQNLYEDIEIRYNGLVPEDSVKLLGPKYALLRREFVEARKSLKMRDGTVKRILIFFGGSDPSNETTKALEAVDMLNRPDIAVDVIVGSSNPHKEKIKKRCSDLSNAYYHCQVDNMAELMARADLAIGAGGSTTWERCFLSVPSITVVIAENQSETTTSVARRGAILNLGWREDVTSERLAKIIEETLASPHSLKKMSERAIKLVGVEGVRPCVDEMILLGANSE